MKKYLYEITIGALVLSVGVSFYYLYSNEEVNIVSSKKDEQVVKLVDVKQQKVKTQNKSTPYTPIKVDAQKASQKMNELKDMLATTENMLKDYNRQNKGNIIIKDKDIEKLVSLDLKHTNLLDSDVKMTNPKEELDNRTENEEIKQLKTASNDSSSSAITFTKSENINNKIVENTDSSKSASSNTKNTVRELETLKIQIESIKKTINHVSSNIN